MTESRGLRDDEAKDRRYHPTYGDSTKLFHVLIGLNITEAR